MDFPHPEEASEDGSIYGDTAALDKEDESGLGEAGVIIVVAEVVTKEVEEVHQAVKYTSLSSFILKPPYLLTQDL